METLPFSLQSYPFAKANARVLASLSRRSRAHGLMRLGLMLLLGAALGVGLSPFDLPVWVELSVAGNAGFLINMGLQRYFIRRHLSNSRFGPTFAGQPRIALTEEGLQLTGQLGESLTRWAGIRDLIPGPDGWIILLTGNSYIPLPKAAFASPAEAEAFVDAVRARIPVVKEPF